MRRRSCRVWSVPTTPTLGAGSGVPSPWTTAGVSSEEPTLGWLVAPSDPRLSCFSAVSPRHLLLRRARALHHLPLGHVPVALRPTAVPAVPWHQEHLAQGCKDCGGMHRSPLCAAFTLARTLSLSLLLPDLCSPNEVSDSGLVPCYRCPRGYIQPLPGSSECLECPNPTCDLTQVVSETVVRS